MFLRVKVLLAAASSLRKLASLSHQVAGSIEFFSGALQISLDKEFYMRQERKLARKAKKNKDFARVSIQLERDDHDHYHFQDTNKGEVKDTNKHS